MGKRLEREFPATVSRHVPCRRLPRKGGREVRAVKDRSRLSPRLSALRLGDETREWWRSPGCREDAAVA